MINTIRVEKKGNYYYFHVRLMGNVEGKTLKFTPCSHVKSLGICNDYLLEQPLPLGKLLTEFLGKSTQCLIG